VSAARPRPNRQIGNVAVLLDGAPVPRHAHVIRCGPGRQTAVVLGKPGLPFSEIARGAADRSNHRAGGTRRNLSRHTPRLAVILAGRPLTPAISPQTGRRRPDRWT
jgi:hypothetical protein